MNARFVFAVAAVTAIAAVGWWMYDDPPLLAEGVDAAAVSDSAPAALAPRRESSDRFASPPARRTAPASSPAPARPPTLYGEFAKARQYRAIYDRLNGSAEGQTAEGRLVLYEILRQCATITEGRRWTGRQPPIPKRDELVAAIAPGDPLRDKRIAAYDDFTINKCAGFEGVSTTQADLSKMLQDSAAAGDPRARAMTIEQEMWRARRQSGDGQATLTDAQIDNLKQAVATRDPEAIRVAGRVFSTTWSDYALRIGPEQMPVEPRAFMNAWLVLACEYGAPCGADTPRMLQACALQGHCDASSYPDYLFQYASTPHDSNLVSQYRGQLRYAIETGDWSRINVVRGLPPMGNRSWFVPGPR